MSKKRKTTINNAFAWAIALVDDYKPEEVAQAIRDLGQDPALDLKCVYCLKEAETWDHLFAIVKDGRYSGFGTTLGNLVPCCKKCNSRKGKKNWVDFLSAMVPESEMFQLIRGRIEAYSRKHPRGPSYEEIERIGPSELEQLSEIRLAILDQMKKADEIAEGVRSKMRASTQTRVH